MARAPYNGKMTFIILKYFCYLGFFVATIYVFIFFLLQFLLISFPNMTIINNNQN